MPMDKFLSSLLAMVKRHEGLTLEAQAGCIGYGHNLTKPITIEAAAHILEDDIYIAMDTLDRNKPFWRMLPYNARLVLLSMMASDGWSTLVPQRTLWLALEQRKYHAAADQVLAIIPVEWAKRRGLELAELMRRAGDAGATEI